MPMAPTPAWGQGEWMVVESDESDGSFLRLPTTIAVVTNIDPEHMEHYGSFDAVRTAYKSFIENIPFYGLGVVCIDHPVVAELAANITDRRLVTYGLNDGADVQAINVQANPYGATFDVLISSRLTEGAAQTLPGFGLPMMGMHNVQNALVPIAIGVTQGIDVGGIRTSLREFQGVKRRFTKTGIVNGITIIDDYGHHPVEIMATLKAARQAVTAPGGQVIAVVQPHRYSRLASLFPEFCTAFGDADRVIVADVYAAGEDPIPGFNRDTLVSGLIEKGKKIVAILNDPGELPDLIASYARPGDFVICLGAGTITTWAHDLPGQLEEILSTQDTTASPEKKIG
jgi:UDP-N-acetylmuramate--alanine ligase